MIWLDAHLSPRIAVWIERERGHSCQPLSDLGLREAEDHEIFDRAREENVVFMTKDSDFPDLVDRLGTPPTVIWLRCGNTTEDNLKLLLQDHLDSALELIEGGEAVVEIHQR